MTKISYSAPAKVILSGEHAVVYGKPALVSAINLRLKFNLWEEKRKINKKNILFIAQKVKEYLNKEKIAFLDKPFNFKIESEIPIGRGLGSSAALSVAAVSSFLHFYTDQQFNKEIINNLAYKIEKYFHQKPSGVDNSTVCFGGLIFYRKEFEFLKNISRLNFKLPKKIEEKLLLIDSGKPKETTAEMVNLVGRLYNKKPKIIEAILNEIEKTTKRMIVSIIKEDSEFFKKSLANNEKSLEGLGVVSKNTKKMLSELSQFGVGKITGAGGKRENSGFILFFSNGKKRLINYLKSKNINYFPLKQDYLGYCRVLYPTS